MCFFKREGKQLLAFHYSSQCHIWSVITPILYLEKNAPRSHEVLDLEVLGSDPAFPDEPHDFGSAVRSLSYNCPTAKGAPPRPPLALPPHPFFSQCAHLSYRGRPEGEQSTCSPLWPPFVTLPPLRISDSFREYFWIPHEQEVHLASLFWWEPEWKTFPRAPLCRL